MAEKSDGGPKHRLACPNNEPGRRVELLSPDYKAGALPLSYPGLLKDAGGRQPATEISRSSPAARAEEVSGGRAPGVLVSRAGQRLLDRVGLRWQGGPVAFCERDRVVLDIERTWWLDGRSKTDVVKARLAISLSRYNQLLTELLGRPEAEAYDPLVVRRLRRARDRRRWATMGATPASDRRHR